MNKRPGISGVVVVFALLGAVVLAFLVIPMLAFGRIGPFEAAWHLLTGFSYFLRKNIAAISTDAGTWAPGLAAFLLGLVVIHWFGRSRAQNRQQVWKVSTTIALGMFLPLLFAISFLVPGVFLQVQQLANTPWLVHESREASYFKRKLQQLGLVLAESAMDNERYPDSLEDLVNRNLVRPEDLFPYGPYPGQPREPMLYLGKGLTMSSDPSLPLLISPPYSQNGAAKRMILTAGHEVVVIPISDLDAWIKRAITAVDGVKH